jgi:hypothetical protein
VRPPRWCVSVSVCQVTSAHWMSCFFLMITFCGITLLRRREFFSHGADACRSLDGPEMTIDAQPASCSTMANSRPCCLMLLCLLGTIWLVMKPISGGAVNLPAQWDEDGRQGGMAMLAFTVRALRGCLRCTVATRFVFFCLNHVC